VAVAADAVSASRSEHAPGTQTPSSVSALLSTVSVAARAGPAASVGDAGVRASCQRRVGRPSCTAAHNSIANTIRIAPRSMAERTMGAAMSMTWGTQGLWILFEWCDAAHHAPRGGFIPLV